MTDRQARHTEIRRRIARIHAAGEQLNGPRGRDGFAEFARVETLLCDMLREADAAMALFLADRAAREGSQGDE